MKFYNYIFLILTGFTIFSCKKLQDDFLNRKPSTILLSDDVWSEPDLVLSVLTDLYDRIPEYQQLSDFSLFADLDEAFPSSNDSYSKVQNQNYDFSTWSFWDYNYVHEVNLFLLNVRKSKNLDVDDQNLFLAEAQFLRANVYFELVKRMGGVPLILDTLEYDFSGDASYLQRPRAKESEIYDFVLDELDSALKFLPKDPNIKSRATWGAGLAMKSRVALYAGSIARYGQNTPSVTLPQGEVGIPASEASRYYNIALNSAELLINSNEYSLFLKYPEDLSKNFSELFLDKNNNVEVIFAKDYLLRSRTTQFTVQNQPHSSTQEGSWSGWLNPSLNLAQSFEKIDGTYKAFETKDVSGNYIRYDNVGDIFKDRDARLGGTLILPGSTFRGQDLDIWAGIMLENGNIISGSQFGQRGTLPGQNTSEQIVGFDGPIDQLEHGTQTGFYIRKYNDPAAGAGEIGTGSASWWIRYRYGEVLLNAAEAAFELANKEKAAQYLNEVRVRAGIIKPLEREDVNFDKIVNERKVELAFECHRLWDMKRWRLAHDVWNGVQLDSDELIHNIGEASKNSSMMFGLWPYKEFAPGKPNNGKWIFKIVKPSEVTNAHQFRIGNYYSRISNDIIGSNPLLVQNPNQ